MNILTMNLIERRKNKGRMNFFILLAFILFEVLYFTYGEQRNMSAHPQGWLSILYYAPLLNSIFLPTIIAILASRHMDLEHQGDNFKLLYTFTRPRNLFFTKICYGSVPLFAACLLQSAALIGVGKYLLFPGQIPFPLFLWFFISTFMVSEILYLLQSILSFFFSNQAVGICIGLAGSLAGTFLLYLPEGIIQRIVPWGLYGCTLCVRMDWNAQTRVVHFYSISLPYKELFFCFCWLAALLYFTITWLRKSDIEGNGFRIRTKSRNTAPRNHRFSFLPAELIKMKNSPGWIALILVPVISAVIGTINFTQNIGVLSNDWYSLWSQHTIFLDYFFLPILVGIFAGCAWRVEHSGTNWNLTAAHVSAEKLVLEKFLVTSLFCGLTLLWVSLLYFIGGKYADIPALFPREFPNWILLGFIGTCCVISIQIFFSLIIRSFVLPIGISFAGGILGLLVSVKVTPYFLPWSLLNIGLRGNNPHSTPDLTKFLLVSAVNILLWLLASIYYIRRSDVKTHE